MTTTTTPPQTESNPLLEKFTGPYAIPPFARIKPAHFADAFSKAFAAHTAEIDTIAAESQSPTFENTIAALERAGAALEQISGVFWNLAAADTNPELQAIERDISPKLAAHMAAISAHPTLFQRIQTVFAAREDLDLTLEQRTVLEKTHRNFIRSGAALPPEGKTRYAEITQRLAALGTQFGQNVLADEAAFALELHTEEDLAGLPQDLRTAAAQAAQSRKSSAPYIITLSRSLVDPFLTHSTRRDLREIVYRAYTTRGAGNAETNNRGLIKEILALRAERAQLLGFATFADFKLDKTMAKTPARALELLHDVWGPAKRRAAAEHERLNAVAEANGEPSPIAAWDWWHYSQKVRQSDFDLRDEDIKPYLSLEQMLAAMFDTAHRLFGVQFKQQTELPLHHPDARAWEVVDRDGSHVGLFIGDYFARPSKRSGAWMSAFRTQQRLTENVRPIIINVCNFAQSEPGQPTLLSLDDMRTLFHEFGHALHGLLSDVTYPSLAGTAVEGDFVELPSQLFEHWGVESAVLQTFARHTETGAPMPDAVIEKIHATTTFNQGFATVEYLASALVDMAFHTIANPDNIDPMTFEADTLAQLGMPDAIGMRHRSPHFLHVFSSEGYAAGYYSYMWSEVLDADAFAAFKETGDIFDSKTAEKLKRFIYSAGGTRPGEDAYLAFRGRLPNVDGLLQARGLG